MSTIKEIRVPEHFRMVHITDQMAILILDSDAGEYYSDVSGLYAISISIPYGDESVVVKAFGPYFPDDGYINRDTKYHAGSIHMLTEYVKKQLEM